MDSRHDADGAGVATYWVYIVRCADGSLYTGITNDLERRVRSHNAGFASKYTRTRTPVTLAYAEEAGGRGEALKRESIIKKMSRSAKLLLCASYSAGKRFSFR